MELYRQTLPLHSQQNVKKHARPMIMHSQSYPNHKHDKGTIHLVWRSGSRGCQNL